jgi:hypothetical protein
LWCGRLGCTCRRDACTTNIGKLYHYPRLDKVALLALLGQETAQQSVSRSVVSILYGARLLASEEEVRFLSLLLLRIKLFPHLAEEVQAEVLQFHLNQLRETDDVQQLRNISDGLGKILSSEGISVQTKEVILRELLRFVSAPQAYAFFKGTGLPVFKSEMTNALGFALLSGLKNDSFASVREGYIKNTIEIAKEKLQVKDPFSYMQGKFLAFNLNTIYLESGLISEELKN